MVGSGPLRSMVASSSSLLLLVLLLAATSICNAQVPDVPMNTRGIDYPEARYRLYNVLAAEEIEKVIALGYNEETWNRPSTANIETISFEGLGTGGTTVQELGISSEQWDCFVNHYQFLEWTELATIGVQDHFVTLGWTEDLWFQANAPETDSLSWDKLSEEEQTAATELCYFQQIWSAQSLEDWTTTSTTTTTTSPPSAVPATAPISAGGTPASSAASLSVLATTTVLLALSVAIAM